MRRRRRGGRRRRFIFFYSSPDRIRIKSWRMKWIEFIIRFEENRNARKIFSFREQITLGDKCRWDWIDCISLS